MQEGWVYKHRPRCLERERRPVHNTSDSSSNMRAFTILVGLAALTNAAPQLTTTPGTTRTTTTSSTSTSPAACASQPTNAAGAGPATSPDTDSAFLANTVYSSAATHAPIPTGYSVAWTNAQAAYSGASYLTYKTLDSYDPNVCASFCASVNGCAAFNICKSC